MIPSRHALAGAALLLLIACDRDAPVPEAEATEVPEQFQSADRPGVATEGIGTPMEERVATIGLVNKRNNISREIELRPGESRRIDDVVIRLSACERTAPWENPLQTGAFVQVFINERPDADTDNRWAKIFSGWVYKETPSLNVVEHPVYDVWVKDCAMSFPGEETAVSRSSSRSAPATPAPATPAPASEPAPEPEAESAPETT